MRQNIFQKAYHRDLEKVYKRFSEGGGGVILDNVIGEIPDIQAYFENLSLNINPDTKILISYHNPAWEPVLSLATSLGLRKKVGLQNWITKHDLKNILEISGFEVVSANNRFWGITAVTVAKPQITNYKLQTNSKHQNTNDAYSVSIIVPARNEEENIAKIIPSIPKFGKSQEIIFVEGNSTDKTWGKILEITNSPPSPRLRKGKQSSTVCHSLFTNNHSLRVLAFKQHGRGKADAVRLGFEKATGDVLMIYDADRTVPAADLPKFYNVLAGGIGEFANGDRLTYPMEDQAMQFLNKIGNKFFSSVFTWIFGQHFKDTLCGTKALFRRDFLKMKKDYLKYLKVDPFGDFALIFSAIKHNLKVVEIPVRYKEREYGKTNIKRFYHGLLLFKLAWIALKEFKL